MNDVLTDLPARRPPPALPSVVAFATTSTSKYELARRQTAHIPMRLVPVALDLPEIQSLNVTEVALRKATDAFRMLRRPLIAEDRGIGIGDRDFPVPW